MEAEPPRPVGLSRLNTRYGPFVVPQECDLIGDSLKSYGEWAQNEISLLRTLIRTGDTVLDIGACYGTHTRAFSDAVGKEGHVLSFEACQQTADLLQENIALAPLDNITMHRCVLDSVSGRQVWMTAPSENRGAMHINHTEMLEKSEPHATAVLNDFSLSRADLLKVDVEGHEVPVLEGGAEMLARCRPIVFCETNTISAGIKLYNFWPVDNYEIFGIRSFATNRDNFFRNSHDFFGDASECSLLFLPCERRTELPLKVSGNIISPIKHTEDIVAMMLGQVQYLSNFWSIKGERHALTQLRCDVLELQKGQSIFGKNRFSIKNRKCRQAYEV